MKLLETLATLTVALAATRAALSGLAASAAALRQAELHSRSLTLARNILETERALPCGRPIPCPPELRCLLDRRVLSVAPGGGLLVLLRAKVTTQSGQPAATQDGTPLAELATAVRRPALCAPSGSWP